MPPSKSSLHDRATAQDRPPHRLVRTSRARSRTSNRGVFISNRRTELPATPLPSQSRKVGGPRGNLSTGPGTLGRSCSRSPITRPVGTLGRSSSRNPTTHPVRKLGPASRSNCTILSQSWAGPTHCAPKLTLRQSWAGPTHGAPKLNLRQSWAGPTHGAPKLTLRQSWAGPTHGAPMFRFVPLARTSEKSRHPHTWAHVPSVRVKSHGPAHNSDWHECTDKHGPVLQYASHSNTQVTPAGTDSHNRQSAPQLLPAPAIPPRIATLPARPDLRMPLAECTAIGTSARTRQSAPAF